ncbi:MerR family transcriptional regulator [Inhella sp.]|uniref:MerR family transcriptional regulator n=1 Tax=Inhella sp. TaxID=1921806 RepID=UPI0035B3EEA8
MDYTVGELAKKAGLTVRTLHHYEQLGLLVPSGRSEAGYRLYNAADVRRLHRVLAYRQSGLALKDIAALLQADSPPLREVLERQIAQVEGEIHRRQRVLRALRHVAKQAHEDEEGLSEHLLSAMSLMRLMEQHFSEAELTVLARRRAQLGEQKIEALEAEWPALIRRAQALMDGGTPPSDPEVTRIALRWRELAQLFIGDQPAFRAKVQAMYAQDGELQRQTGVTPQLLAYLRQSLPPTATPSP